MTLSLNYGMYVDFYTIDDLSRFVLILLRMCMQEFSAGNKNINKGADQCQ